MSRTRVRRRQRVALVLISAGIAATLAGPLGRVVGGEPARPVGHRVYVVKPGDTLWGIALRVGTRGDDPRVLIGAIARTNDLDGELLPGETLVIPAS